MDALNSGSMLGRYELLVRLGRGGMASVWVAREVRDGEQRLVAVKAMLPELARRSDFRSMFLEEGQIIRSIDHPHVVKVHDVGEAQGVLYMAMEWVEGDSLRTLIQEARRRRPIPTEIAVKVIADAASGLHAAHELQGWDGKLRNIVHCDVSPHNILVGIDGRAKIVDFGVAQASMHGDFDSEDKIKGKFAYMSPEQADGRRIDRRSDVFALGAVLFELLTGERLFRGESQAHTLTLVTSGKIPDPREVRPDYPERLAAITRQALARDPIRRFQTADAMREALERYLVEERTLVAHASVAKLVRRVLGTRIEQLRQNLRETLVVQDGVLRAELIPDVPAAIGTYTELPPQRDPPPGYSGTPRPQSYEPPVAPHSPWPPLLAAIGGIAAAASSIWWVTHHSAAPPLAQASARTRTNPPAAAAPSAPAARAETSEPSAPGVDISSIPLGASSDEAVNALRPGRRSGARRPTASSEERVELEETPSPEPTTGARAADADVVVRDNTVSTVADGAAQKAAPAPEHVELEETPTSAPQAAPATSPTAVAADPAMTSPFNRGAAIAQLNAVSGRAMGCASGGGPSGSGRANITFSPNGRAARVALGAPFVGTPVGQCVINVFQTARVPPFTGSPVTLPWSFRVRE
jgi:serine/threonine protein kinase